MSSDSHADFGTAWYRINAVYEKFARSNELSLNGMLVFAHVCREEGITQTEVGERALIPKQTANSIVKALLNRGLIELKSLESDKRSKGIFLTSKGLEFKRRTIDKISRAERSALEGLDVTIREAMVEGLTVYAAAFHKALLDE